jgi:hypothetical protein
MNMKLPRTDTALRIASVAALIALGLMVWSFIDPSPMAMVVAMSVGQGLGTFSFLLFAAVVAVDIFVKRRSKRE